jgi:segregation and condensation protein A
LTIEASSTSSLPETNFKDDLDLGDPAEVLVELARKGEIDPWDIDITKLTEKFLEYIQSLENRDLRIPARTLLYASILLRMKSDSLEDSPVDEEVAELEFLLDEIEFRPHEEYLLPQPPLRRRTKRPVTLAELIAELKKAEMVGRRKEMREHFVEVIEEKTLDLSHEEGIEDRIRSLWPVLEEIFNESKSIALKNLDGELVMNYISLLFMAQRKQVWLDQEEIFGELYIKRPA